MLSSDKNVETLTQLIEMLKHNFELRTEYAKLDATEKIVRLLSAGTLAVLLLMIFTATMLFVSLAAAWWLSQFMGLTAAFLCVAGFYALALVVCYLCRKAWLERPLVKFLARILMS
ncbi:MAG: phage holin family protein [Prevotella sp.]|nr:phage holin family protein [Prevotella sp.]